MRSIPRLGRLEVCLPPDYNGRKERRAIDDSQLIALVRTGKRDRYAELVRRYQEKVWHLCVSMLADQAAAEDAAQEIFLKAYHALDQFRGDAAFSTWLYRIAANHCRDLLRQSARQPTQSWEALVEQHGAQIERLIAAPATVERHTEAAELVQQVLAHLSADYRLILILREIEGFSYEELARTLDCTLDAVKARLRRARVEFEKKFRHVADRDNV